MKKFKEFMKKYFNQKVRNIISIFIIIFGLTFMYIYSFKSPTYINKIIATNIYKEPANSAFIDQNFYNCVIDAYNKENNASKGYTENLSDDELKKITKLECGSYVKNAEEMITNTYGLEKLTSLTSLDLYFNKLITLDVSQNTALTSLNVGRNDLTTLDVSQNTALIYLDVYKNKLTTLDVSKNIALVELGADVNNLSSLDVSQNTALTSLNVSCNDLTTLDVSQNIALTSLNVGLNDLTILDANNNVELKYLYAYNNQLTSLDVSQNTALISLDAYNNQLTSLDVSQNTALTSLNVYSNDLTTLDVSQNTALTRLNVYSNNLTTLDVSQNTALIYLWVYSNDLTTLDVSQNTALISLDAYNNQLTSLDVSQNTALIYLDAYNNQLTSIDIGNNEKLRELQVYNNNLTTLDVSQNTALTELSVYNNQLTSLDVSQNTALTSLNISSNKLTTLDVSNNVKLTELSIYNNQVASLYIGNNAKLTKLEVYNNQLTTLDVSQNTALTSLYAYNNQLTNIDIGNNEKLTELSVYNNQLTSLDVSKNLALKYLNATNNQFKLFKKIYLGDIISVDSSMIKFPNPDSTTYKGIRSDDDSILKITDVGKIEGVALGTTNINSYVENSDIKVLSDSDVTVVLPIVNVITVVEMTSDKYLIDSGKGYIFTYSDIDGDTIKSNLSVSDSEVEIVISDNNLKLMDGDKVIKEFKIINVVSDKYYLGNDIYAGSDISDITCNNCKASIDDTGLVISDNNDNKVYTYKILNIDSDIYEIIDDKIIVFDDYDDNSTIINNIKSNYGTVKVNNKIVQIVYNNEVIREYGLIGIKSSKYNLDSSLIIAPEEEVINNITCYNCDMEIVNSKLLIKYGDNIIREYTLLTIDSEYRIIRDTIFVGNDYDDNDLIMSKISVSYGSISISDEKKLVISDGDTILKEYTLSDSDEYIDIVDYEMDDNELIVSRIDIGTSIDIFNGKIDANIAQGYEIFDKDDNAIGDRVLRTGDKLRVRFSVEPIDYILSVKGDVLGTGDPGIEDGKLIAKHIIDGNVINGGEYLLAADYDGDGNIKMNDVVRMLKERQ